MKNNDMIILPPEELEPVSLTLRDIVAVGFRHRRLLLFSFFAILLGAVVGSLFLPKYKAEMMILVKKERVDPAVTPEDKSPPQYAHDNVTEEEVNSEVALLTSSDLLGNVVIASHLENKEHNSLWAKWALGASDGDTRVAQAVRHLEKQLTVDPIRKTNLIEISYRSRDPEEASLVLHNLAALYLQKHMEVHRPPGQFDFFQQQSAESRKRLMDAESRLVAFPKAQNAVAAQLERDSTLQQLAQFEAALQQARSSIKETKDRIATLEAEAKSTPERITTQIRDSDNPQLQEQMKATLLTLQLKKSDLLSKYQPSYPLVVEVEREIAKTQATIAAEEKAPIKEQTTDRDTTYDWILSDLAKARTDLATYEARQASLEQSIGIYTADAQRLNQASIAQQNLLREVRMEEDSYSLYQHKREEARISAALDQSRILNVAVAQEPTVPRLPAHAPWMLSLLSILAAALGSSAVVFVREHFDPSFRTPAELQRFMAKPILAALPKEGTE